MIISTKFTPSHDKNLQENNSVYTHMFNMTNTLAHLSARAVLDGGADSTPGTRGPLLY